MRRAPVLAAAAGALLLARGAHASTRLGLGPAPAVFETAPAAYRLDGAALLPAVPRLDPEEPVPPPATKRRLFDRKTLAVTAGLAALVPAISYAAWWRGSRTSTFNQAHENWFGEETYAGGADKASHIVIGYFAQQALQSLYRGLGHTRRDARTLSVGVGVALGLLIELGDGFSQYGAAWEDAVSNTLGIGFAAYLDAHGLHDTLGMRVGFVKALIPDPCCRYGGYGGDYSREIYTLDLKLAGLLPRMGAKPGIARFLLVSFAYDTKGYRYSDPAIRERNLGLEVGLNVAEVLRAAGVRDSTWWGKPLLLFATYFRIPYTAFGWRYDMNHQKWSGPNTGDQFDPGSIIYD